MFGFAFVDSEGSIGESSEIILSGCGKVGSSCGLGWVWHLGILCKQVNRGHLAEQSPQGVRERSRGYSGNYGPREERGVCTQKPSW